MMNNINKNKLDVLICWVKSRFLYILIVFVATFFSFLVYFVLNNQSIVILYSYKYLTLMNITDAPDWNKVAEHVLKECYPQKGEDIKFGAYFNKVEDVLAEMESKELKGLGENTLPLVSDLNLKTMYFQGSEKGTYCLIHINYVTTENNITEPVNIYFHLKNGKQMVLKVTDLSLND